MIPSTSSANPELNREPITFKSLLKTFNEGLADPEIQRIRFSNWLREASLIRPTTWESEK